MVGRWISSWDLIPLYHKFLNLPYPVPFPLAWAQDALAQNWNMFNQVLIFSPPDLAREMTRKLLSFKGGGG